MTDGEYTVNDLIRDELYKNVDLEYGRFQASIIPGCGNIIGVRMPVLRKMAKEIAAVNWKEYLSGALDDTYEEIMLQALVLGYARGNIEDIISYVEAFLPKIDNWSICDSFCSSLKQAQQYQEEFWELIMKHFSPETNEFVLRFSIVMMMDYYLNDRYIDKVLYAYDYIRHDGYYVKMAVAWGLATAYVRYPGKTMALMEDNNIDDDTYNKAISKMLESFRISDDDKEILKSMRR